MEPFYQAGFDIQLSDNAKRSFAKGMIIGSISLLVYILVVVVTTPSLPPAVAIRIAFTVNSAVMVGMTIGIGVQVFISSYSRLMGCRLDKKKGFIGAGSGGGTALSSFLSFFSLVPLGCCGTWLYILSFLPSIVGGTLSATLIQYSRPLSYIGLAVVWGFAVLSAIKLNKELTERKTIINDHEDGSSQKKKKKKLDGDGGVL
jgi:hypothetical protein